MDGFAIIAEPARRGNQSVGIVLLTREAREVDQRLFQIRASVLLLFGTALGLTVMLSFYLARTIATKSAYTLKVGKEAFYRQAEMSLADAYLYTAQVMTENMMARDAEVGIGAFIDKRAPRWEDR